MKKHNLILVAFFSLTMATGCYNGHILDKPITMLANDKKTLVTPPTSFDYSYKLQGPSGSDPIWHCYNVSTSGYALISYTRSVNASYGYNYDSGYLNLAGFEDLEWRLRFYGSDTAWFSYGERYLPWYNYIGTSTQLTFSKYTFEFFNMSQYNYLLYLDFTSSSTNFLNVQYYTALSSPPFHFQTILVSDAINLNNNVVMIPAFSTVNMFSASGQTTQVKLDAMYFDKLPITQGMSGYANENYNSGYDDGFRSVDNLQWLENVATAVKDIFSVEIFPGFTVGFIVLFPLVVAIVKWFLSLFGIGGGS